MKNKTVRLLFSPLLTKGDVKAYSVKSGGYQHLVIAPANHLAEIETAVREASIARQVAFLRATDADPLDIRLAAFPDSDPEIVALEVLRHETLIILPSALKALKPEKAKKPKGRKLADDKPLKRKMSQETKDKISATRRASIEAKKQSSLLQAVEQGGLVEAPPPAQPE